MASRRKLSAGITQTSDRGELPVALESGHASFSQSEQRRGGVGFLEHWQRYCSLADSQFQRSRERARAGDCFEPRRLAQERLANSPGQYDAPAAQMKSIVVDARPRRGGLRRTEKLQLAANPGRPDEAETGRVELEKAPSPAGAQRALAGVVADRGFSVLADADGQALRDRAVGGEYGRGEELTDVGLVPAAVHPVFLNLLFRIGRRPLGGTGAIRAVIAVGEGILIPREGLAR